MIRFALSITLSTTALTLSQAPISLALLTPFALVPWLLLTRRLGATMAMLSGLVLGTAYVCAAAHWLVPAWTSQGAIGFRPIVATIATGLWAKGLLFGVIGWAAQRLRNRDPALQALGLGSLIALGEGWAGHSRLGLPLLLLGHSQYGLPGIMQLAVATGVPGLSALLIAMNSSLASFASRQWRSERLLAALFAAWFGLVIGGETLVKMIRSTAGSGSRTLLLIQPHSERGHRWDPAFQQVMLERIGEYTARALGTTTASVDLIVWPESLLTQPFDDREDLESLLQAKVEEWGIPLVTGLVRTPENGSPGEYLNSSVWWTPGEGLEDAVDKNRAIPLVESSRDFLGRDVLAELLGKSQHDRKVSEATETRSLAGSFIVTPTLCFEILFPGEVAARRDAGSVAILNLADDSWVAGESVDHQILAAAAFRAVEQRLPLVRVGHGGLSGMIDVHGRVVATLPPDRYAHMTAEVAAAESPSEVEKTAVLALPALSGALAWLCISAIGNRPSRDCRTE